MLNANTVLNVMQMLKLHISLCIARSFSLTNPKICRILFAIIHQYLYINKPDTCTAKFVDLCKLVLFHFKLRPKLYKPRFLINLLSLLFLTINAWSWWKITTSNIIRTVKVCQETYFCVKNTPCNDNCAIS